MGRGRGLVPVGRERRPVLMKQVSHFKPAGDDGRTEVSSHTAPYRPNRRRRQHSHHDSRAIRPVSPDDVSRSYASLLQSFGELGDLQIERCERGAFVLGFFAWRRLGYGGMSTRRDRGR